MLNSCYGFTLCNISSEKFKTYENRRCFPKTLKKRNKFKSVYKFEDKVYLVQKKKKIQESFYKVLPTISFDFFSLEHILNYRKSFLSLDDQARYLI